MFSYLKGKKYIEQPPFKNAEPTTIYVDNNTGRELNLHRPTIDRIYLPGTGGKPRKVLGIHGYNKTGAVVDFFASMKDSFDQKGVTMIAPFFQKGEVADYTTWEKVLDENFTDDVDTVVTHSMGGRVAVEYIIAHKKKINRLVLVAPSLRANHANVQKLYDELKQDVGSLKNFVQEIIVLSSNDDVGREGKAKAFAEAVGGKHIEVSGYGHFNLVSSQLIDGIVEFGAPIRRIPEVLDVWMDSASMPYAQVHYPFENREKMEASFPADFIAEYTGQIRAWFYVMHAIGVMVKGSPAFKNVAVT